MLKINELTPEHKDLRQCLKKIYRNEKAFKIIEDTFKSKEGYIKPYAGFLWEYPKNEKGEDAFYPVGFPRKGKPLETLSGKDIFNKITYCRTLHVFDFVYDDGVKNVFERDDSLLRPHFGGINIVLDVDSPDNPDLPNTTRYDCLSSDRNIRAMCLNNFNTIKEIAKRELQEIEIGKKTLWDECKVMFSGNGMYIILPSMYASEITRSKKKIPEIMLQYEDYAIDLMYKVNKKTQVTGRYPLVDHGLQKKWQDFHKIPFTLHYKYDRMSIPLNKDQPLRGKELIEWTNPFKLAEDPLFINEIIEKSGW